MPMRGTLTRQLLQNERDLCPPPSSPEEWQYRGWLDLALEVSQFFHPLDKRVHTYILGTSST